MKKYLAIILALALAASMISACGGASEETQPAETEIETEAETNGGTDGPVISNGDDEGMVGLPNPLIEVTIDEQEEMTGLRLEAPEDAEDVQYFVITDKSESPMAQTVFTIDGVEWCYRAEPTAQLEAYDNTGMYYEWEDEGTAMVDYCDCYYCLGSEAAICYWMDIVPGVNYSLSASSAVEMEQIVGMANHLFFPLQAED